MPMAKKVYVFRPNNERGLSAEILANTIKGKGISFMENKACWHHGVITDELYQTCLKELEEAKNEQNI